MSASLDEILFSIDSTLPCRGLQIRQITSLLQHCNPSSLVVHGGKATGKSRTIKAVLESIDTPSVVVQSRECITTRHLLERTISFVRGTPRTTVRNDIDRSYTARCESISAFVVELQQLLEQRGRLILVFDGVDRQREAAPTLLPALVRLGEVIPPLTTIFITTTSNPHLFHHSSLPHIYFPPYNRAEILTIIARSPPPAHSSTSASPAEDAESQQPLTSEDTTWLWTRFTAAAWDSLGQSNARDIVSFHEVCSRLWEPFIQPIKDGLYGPREFSKLIVRNRGLFQGDSALIDSIVPIPPKAPEIKTPKTSSTTTATLPYYPAHLLISSYLASHNSPRHDITLFSKTSLSKRRKRRGGGGGTALNPHRASKHRKISRKLLGPQPFPLERLLGIFHAILPHEMKGGGADVMCMVATLVGLRLMVRAGAGGGGGAGDVLEGGGEVEV